jgi:hypothetical protein
MTDLINGIDGAMRVPMPSAKGVVLKTACKLCETDIVVTPEFDIPEPPNIQPLTITENGTYTAEGGVDGYSPITVEVAASGGAEWIGDGKTHLWIEIVNDEIRDVSLSVKQSVNYGVTVDWGDGSEPHILASGRTCSHTYESVGKYIITLDVSEGCTLDFTSGSTGYCIVGKSESRRDTTKLKKVEIGKGVNAISAYAFYNCHALANIFIPDSVTSIARDIFYNCYSLASVVIPAGVTSISYSTFGGCISMLFYDFTQFKSVPTLVDKSAFNNIPSDCEIRVPMALVDEWKAATNWSNYATKIVGV